MRLGEVDCDELPQPTDTIAELRRALLREVAQPFRKPSALLQKPVEQVARCLLSAEARVGVRKPAVLGEPGVEIDGAFHLSRSVIGNDHEVLVGTNRFSDRADRFIEEAVDRRHPAVEPSLLPLEPAIVLHVVRRHEDDEQESRVEALSEP